MASARQWVLSFLTAALAATPASCCFTESSSVTTTTTIERALPPVDPSIDALWVCANVVDDRCVAPVSTFPSTTFEVYISFRTHDVPRFSPAATLIVYTGEAERRELGRVPLPESSGQRPEPGHILTWTASESLTAPAAGWPVEMPVHFELVDSLGVVVTSTPVTFTGPRTPTRPAGVLAVCRTDQLAGSERNRYCPTTNDVVIGEPTQALWVTYSSGDPAFWAPGIEIVLERQRGRRWVHANTERMDPYQLPPDALQTLHVDYPMNQSDFAAGNVLRVRLRSGGSDVATATFTMQAPSP